MTLWPVNAVWGAVFSLSVIVARYRYPASVAAVDGISGARPSLKLHRFAPELALGVTGGTPMPR